MDQGGPGVVGRWSTKTRGRFVCGGGQADSGRDRGGEAKGLREGKGKREKKRRRRRMKGEERDEGGRWRWYG